MESHVKEEQLKLGEISTVLNCVLFGIRVQQIAKLPCQPVVSLGIQDGIVFIWDSDIFMVSNILSVACMRILLEQSFQTS